MNLTINRTRAAFATVLAVVIAGLLAAFALTSGQQANATVQPGSQPTGNVAYACVNGSGKIDYLEFRLPLPHNCWFKGETRWAFSIVPTPVVTPPSTPPATNTGTASPGASPSGT